MRYVAVCALLFFLLLTPRLSYGQGSVEVSVCDLLLNPTQYDMKTVQVRGRVDLAFEGFGIEHPPCASKDIPGLWLEFGGDQSTPAVYCCGNHERVKGEVLTIKGRPIPLVRDATLEEFWKRLTAERIRRPDGQPCESRECYFYDVTATLTGLFVAGDTSSNAVMPGYGHLGCCHLFVIQKVDDVVAERTLAPAGGQLRCSTKTWTESPERLAWPSPSDRNYGSEIRGVVAKVAKSWGDEVDVEQGRLSCWGVLNPKPATRYCQWTAADLATVYKLQTSLDPEPGPNVLVSRQKCLPPNPGDAPWPASLPVQCDTMSWQWNGTGATAPALQKAADERNEGWRASDLEAVARETLERAIKQWALTVLQPQLECDEPQGDEDFQISGCHWTSPDDMQTLGVTVRKFRSMKKAGQDWKDVIWVATDAGATICRIEQ